MLCLLAATAVQFAVVSPPASPPSPLWGELVAAGSGRDTQVMGQVAYETSPGLVALVVNYEDTRGLPAFVSLTAVAGRRLDARTRLDLQVWSEVGRGGGVGFVVRRQLGR